ncbi:hypothetical protein HG530_003872 [Fusarium avenaceum]|nr:hypothetical protein HG530_003872 [Fusarium avenaceum]
MSKDPASITASVLGKGQNRDDNSNNTSKSPEDSGGRGEVQAYINPREVLVAERGDSIAQESQGEEDQEDLVGLSGHDADAGARLKDIDARDDEEGGSEVHGESDCDVSNERSSNTDNDHRDSEPSPDDVDGAAANQRVGQGCSETVGDGSEDEGHEGDLERRAISRKLSLVAHGLEELIGRVRGAIAARRL